MRSEPQKIIFHAGAHKTATTLLQSWIEINRDKLLQSDLSACNPKDLQGSKFDRFCFELSKPRTRTISTNDAIDTLLNTWHATGRASTLLVSKENMLGEAGRLYINAKYVLSELADSKVKDCIFFVFYIRRNDHFIESHILQQYSHGKQVSVSDVIHLIQDRSWSSVIDEIELNFPGRVSVEFFERISRGPRSYIERFCSLCGIEKSVVENSRIPSFREQNRSLSSTGLNLLLELWNTVSDDKRIDLFEKIREIHHTGTSERPSLLSDKVRHELLRYQENSNRYLIKRYADNDPDLLAAYCPQQGDDTP